MRKISDFFIQHPESVGMNYLQHFRFAISLAWEMFKATIASLIHAFLPFCFTTYTSKCISRLHTSLASRGSQPAAFTIPAENHSPAGIEKTGT